MELTFWTAGVNFGVNLDLVLVLILEFFVELTFRPVFRVNFAGVNFLTLIDAQGEPIGRGLKLRALVFWGCGVSTIEQAALIKTTTAMANL